MAVVQQPGMNGDLPNFALGSKGDDAGMSGNLQEEIENIQRVIKVTRKKLEAMNEEFGKHQHPPSIYVQEYEELANKIHEYQLREQMLQEQMSVGGGSPPSTPPHNKHQPEEPLLSPRLPHAQNHSNNNLRSLPVGQRSPQLGTRSTVPHIKAYLPNNMVTAVVAHPGTTLKDGLMKAMNRRQLDPFKCQVFRHNTRIQLTWNTDMGELAGQEVSVELLEIDDESSITRNMPRAVVLAHNFGRKTYFSLTFCDVCRNLLFQSIRCQTCGLKFHHRCEDKVPRNCQGDLEVYLRSARDTNRDFVRQYITDTQGAPSNKQGLAPSKGGHQSRSIVPQLGQRERSTSAPNVCANMVDCHDLGQEECLRRFRELQSAHARRSGTKLFSSYRYSFYKDKRHASDSSASFSKNVSLSKCKVVHILAGYLHLQRLISRKDDCHQSQLGLDLIWNCITKEKRIGQARK